jgi:YgiT-type zinc finger domain-containing protein
MMRPRKASPMTRPCRLPGCPGREELQGRVEVERHKGQLILFRNVPAWVCHHCGDITFTADTVRRLEQLREEPGQPVGTVPLYEYVPAEVATGREEET